MRLSRARDGSGSSVSQEQTDRVLFAGWRWPRASSRWLLNSGIVGDILPLDGFYGMVRLDGFALLFKAIFLIGAALAIAISTRYLDIEGEQHGEYYALVLFATVGMMFLACGYDLIVLYISLELMALTFYVLVAFTKREKRSNEAAMKYFLLGAFSSGVLLYGMSLLYGIAGSTNLGEIGQQRRRGCRQCRSDPARNDQRFAAADVAAGNDCASRGFVFQDRRSSVSHVGARCLRRRANFGHRVSFHRLKSRQLCALRENLCRSSAGHARRLGAAARSGRRDHHHGRQLGGGHAGKFQTSARLFVDFKRWIFVAGTGGRKRLWLRRPGDLSAGLHADEHGRVWHHHQSAPAGNHWRQR